MGGQDEDRCAARKQRRRRQRGWKRRSGWRRGTRGRLRRRERSAHVRMLDVAPDVVPVPGVGSEHSQAVLVAHVSRLHATPCGEADLRAIDPTPPSLLGRVTPTDPHEARPTCKRRRQRSLVRRIPHDAKLLAAQGRALRCVTRQRGRARVRLKSWLVGIDVLLDVCGCSENVWWRAVRRARMPHSVVAR